MTTVPTVDTPDPLLAEVLAGVQGPDPRLRRLVECLVRHLHAAVRESRPTPGEWAALVDFLLRSGRACSAEYNEFALLSDVLGLTSAVDDVNHAVPPGMTPSSVEGLYDTSGPQRALERWTRPAPEERPGEAAVVVHGRVSDCTGRPVAGAVLDVWQADDAAPSGPDHAGLRGLSRTDDHGRYWFRTVRPRSGPVPADGPVGQLLAALGRHPVRPAHLHLHVEAPGFRPLTTQLYPAGDPYLGCDPAFAVKPDLVVEFTWVDDPDVAARYGVDGPFLDVPFDLRLMR